MAVGGARPGAGAPTRDSCRLKRLMVLNITRVKLERLQTKWGVARLGLVLDRLMESVEVEEPEYARLAREVRESGVLLGKS